MKWLLIFFVFSLASCGPSIVQERTSEIIVTYEGKEVYRAGSKYSSMKQLSDSMNYNSSGTYIIFGADWCTNCRKLYKFLEQTDSMKKVTLLNVEEQWVSKMSMTAGIHSVPTMIVTNNAGDVVAIERGATKIALYLFENLD